MPQLDLKHLYQILDYSYQQRDKPLGESVCIVVVPPREISEQFNMAGKEKEDNSPSHCTVAYLGKVAPELESKIKAITENVCNSTKPFNAKIGDMDIFENDKHDVWHMRVKGKKIHDFRNSIKQAFNANQMQIDTKHPEFKPHITLEYAEKGQQPKHIQQIPQGKWTVDNAWLWGLSEPYLLQFK